MLVGMTGLIHSHCCMLFAILWPEGIIFTITRHSLWAEKTHRQCKDDRFQASYIHVSILVFH